MQSLPLHPLGRRHGTSGSVFTLPRSKESYRQIRELGKRLVTLAEEQQPELFANAVERPLEVVETWPGISLSLVDEPRMSNRVFGIGRVFLRGPTYLSQPLRKQEAAYFHSSA